MSWTPQATILLGYKIPRTLWDEGIDFCEENNELIPFDWEDMFIDMDPVSGNENETFFGKILYTLDDNDATREFNEILPESNLVKLDIKRAFNIIFPNLDITPILTTYIGTRWI